MKRTLCILLALLLAFAAFPVLAADTGERDAAVYAISPAFSDGVTLSYDAATFTLCCSEVYGLLRVAENKTLTLTASFDEGWTFNADYSNFFRDRADRVTIIDGADGNKVFVFEAVKGDYLTKDTLSTVGVYATPDALPRLEINTSVPFSQITKEEYVEASYTLTLGTKQYSSGNYEGTGFVKGRGNSSWEQPQKPYSIKLDKKASLLDIPKTKKYAIVPSYSDQALIRNYLTYKSGLMLDGIDYVPKCEFVEVYLNGSYNGIYILVERIAIESSKIDIEEATAEELTGGYIIEKDMASKIDFDSDLWFDCPYWANKSQDYFVIKDPEPEDTAVSDQMRAYLADYMQELHSAVMDTNGNAYAQYVDVGSWIDFIIIQELAKNIDGNLKTSCYMIKKANDDMLYLTAPWDFDLAYGNPATTWTNASNQYNDYYDCPNAQSPSDFMTINSSCPWFDTLYYEHEEFRSALIQRYEYYRGTLVPAMLRMIDCAAAYLDAAAVANDAKWNKHFVSGVDYLRDWLITRIEWLDSVWLDSEPIDLDLALNAAGGNLHFETANYPFTGAVKNGRFAGVSGNTGVNNSISSFTVTIDMLEGETLSFDYRYSTESNYDFFNFKVNGTQLLHKSGESDWKSYTFTAESNGSYTFVWEYTKDGGVNTGSDCVYIDEISYSGILQPAALLGDADCNGVVNFGDISLLSLFLAGDGSMTEQGRINSDLEGDGSASFSDLSLLYLFLISEG